jgi:hypothetical protein
MLMGNGCEPIILCRLSRLAQVWAMEATGEGMPPGRQMRDTLLA